MSIFVSSVHANGTSSESRKDYSDTKRSYFLPHDVRLTRVHNFTCEQFSYTLRQSFLENGPAARQGQRRTLAGGEGRKKSEVLLQQQRLRFESLTRGEPRNAALALIPLSGFCRAFRQLLGLSLGNSRGLLGRSGNVLHESLGGRPSIISSRS